MTVKQAHSRLIMQLGCGTRILRVIHGRDPVPPLELHQYAFPGPGALCRFQLDTASGTSRSLYGNGGQAIGTVFGGRFFTLS